MFAMHTQQFSFFLLASYVIAHTAVLFFPISELCYIEKFVKTHTASASIRKGMD